MSKSPEPRKGTDSERAKAAKEQGNYLHRKLARNWIEQVTGDVLVGEFGLALKDGQVLCKLINIIKPGSVKKIETASMAFKQMENISNFLKACRAVGMIEHEMFETVDLYEQKV
jgi:transgelin